MLFSCEIDRVVTHHLGDEMHGTGLVAAYLLFVMGLATRRVHFAGSTTNPDESWLLQVAWNLTDAE